MGLGEVGVQVAVGGGCKYSMGPLPSGLTGKKSVPKRENAELLNSEGASGSACSAGLWKYPSAGNGHFGHLNILAHVGTHLSP